MEQSNSATTPFLGCRSVGCDGRGSASRRVLTTTGGVNVRGCREQLQHGRRGSSSREPIYQVVWRTLAGTMRWQVPSLVESRAGGDVRSRRTGGGHALVCGPPTSRPARRPLVDRSLIPMSLARHWRGRCHTRVPRSGQRGQYNPQIHLYNLLERSHAIPKKAINSSVKNKTKSAAT